MQIALDNTRKQNGPKEQSHFQGNKSRGMRSSLDPGLTENALHKIRNKQWDYQGCALYQLPTQLVNSTISCVTNQMHAQMVKYQPAKIVD